MRSFSPAVAFTARIYRFQCLHAAWRKMRRDLVVSGEVDHTGMPTGRSSWVPSMLVITRFFELDDRRDVRHALVERRQVVLVHDRVRVERSPARRRLPLHVVAPALRAEGPRIEVVLVAGIAVPDEEAPLAATVPERLRLEVGGRDVEAGTGHVSRPPEARPRPRPGSSPRRSRSRLRTRGRSRCWGASH